MQTGVFRYQFPFHARTLTILIRLTGTPRSTRYPLLDDIDVIDVLRYSNPKNTTNSSNTLEFIFIQKFREFKGKELHKIPVVKAVPLGQDLLSLRENELEKLAPEGREFKPEELWGEDQHPSRLHLTMIKFGYSPDEHNLYRFLCPGIALDFDHFSREKGG
jgi:hypothetical protein